MVNETKTHEQQSKGKPGKSLGVAVLILLIIVAILAGLSYALGTLIQVPYNTTENYPDFESYTQNVCDDVLVPFLNTSCWLKSNLSSEPARQNTAIIDASSIPVAGGEHFYFSSYFNVSRMPKLRVSGVANTREMSFYVMNQGNFDSYEAMNNYTPIVRGNGDFSFIPASSDYYFFILDNEQNAVYASADLRVILHYDINISNADLNVSCSDVVLYGTEKRCRDVQRRKAVERTRIVSKNESLLEKWQGTNNAIKV